MKITYNWLKDYLDHELPPEELGRILTMAGLEVEEIAGAGEDLEGVVVARILEVEPHPNADRLSLCRVQCGADTLQVVCGAPNVKKGALAPLAPPGTTLPRGLKVESAEIRGVVSNGMLLAEDEMGLTGDHSGIMILPPSFLPGTPILHAIPLKDWVFDISITPNRADCTSVIGIAREVAAAVGMKIKFPDTEFSEKGPAIENVTSVRIEDPLGCPRYAAGLIQGVELKASPFPIRYRLHLCGIRSINNIVDVTNYVMLEMGQPLHAFDYHRLHENRIVVKRAVAGDRFTTLDGQIRSLDRDAVMICDGEKAVALAGIMGGLNSEIFSETRDVLIESACFDPVSIRRTSKRLGLSSEASYRFERGVDIEGVPRALKRAVSMLSELAGGHVARGIIDNYPRPLDRKTIDLRVGKTNHFLGTALETKEMGDCLRSLEMEVEEVKGDLLRVTPPSFRVDLSREVDLMEEVARLSGYEKIPVTAPRISPSEEGAPPELLLRDCAKAVFVGHGFNEVITYSFISPDSAQLLGAEEGSPLHSFVKIFNPLSAEQSVMRTSLLPGLLSTVRSNQAHGERELKLFEWGKVFFGGGEDLLPLEKTFLGAVMAGPFREKTWYAEEREVDFFDIKGAAEAVLRALNVRDVAFQRGEKTPGYLPESTAFIYSGEEFIGRAGQVSPGAVAGFELKSEKVYLLELDMGAVFKGILPRRFRPFARYPAVYRDLSLIVKRTVESSRIMEIIAGEGGALVESVQIFDLYEGEKMDSSEKAIAFRICYRSQEGTLEGGFVNRLHESIIRKIGQETGGRLREG
jgi:phenylalanyl-tRNA synthetase beta chain